jgi:cytochrome c-type protein NapB
MALFPHDNAAPGAALTRAAHLALAAVIGLAFVGFVVGIRQGKTVTRVTPVPLATVEPRPDAIPATAYRDLDRRKTGPNRDWHSTLVNLPQPMLDLAAQPRRTEEGRQEVLATRASRRAYDGAPPTVPHPIDQTSASSCLVCHGEGLAISDALRAPVLSHALLTNCTQCHVEQASVVLEPVVVAENTSPAPQASTPGRRAWPGAPPTVPHATWMRTNCLSCHGPTGAEPIRTSHPLRANCLQCHAPSAVLDQAAPNDQPHWLDQKLDQAGIASPSTQTP